MEPQRNGTSNGATLPFPEKITAESLKSEILNSAKISKPKANKQIFTADKLLSRGVTVLPTLLDPILPKTGLAALAGSSDTGKSSFLRQLAIAVAIGDKTFLGWKLHLKHERAIYVSTEDDDYAISYLMQKANQSRKLPSSTYKRLTYIFDTDDLLLSLKAELDAFPVDLIVIDAFTDLYGKSMNDTNQVRTFLNDFSQLAQQYKCLIIFLHHTGKRTEELEPSKHNLLGSQGFEAKMRLVIELRNAPNDCSLKHMCIVKGNYLSREHKELSYALNFNSHLEFSKTGQRLTFSELKFGNRQGDLKQEIEQLKADGFTQEEIASELNISQSKVSRILKRN